MKGIDTNVLVRVLVKDDKIQSKKAYNYIKKHNPVFVSLPVLCETCWVLKSCYEVQKNEIIKILEQVLQTEQINVENAEVAWQAINTFKHGKGDYADYLIAHIAKHYDCDALASFDKVSAKSNLFEFIS